MLAVKDTELMVLGVLTAVGVIFITGYATRALTAGSTGQVNEDDRRVDQLQRRLKELEKARSGSGCWYFLTFFLIFGFLIALGSILYATNFFRSRKALSTVWLDWNYWLNYDNYKIFNYNYSGIAGVAVTVILVVFPLLMILCKLCWDVRRHEKELKETREELERVQQDQRIGGDVAYAQGGYVNIAIADCFNVHCTCYVTLVFTATPVAFLSVVIFVCYVLYTYLSK